LRRFGPDKVNLLNDGGYLLVMKNHEKGPEQKDSDGPQIAVDADGFFAE
jgi:hypothetical protein